MVDVHAPAVLMADFHFELPEALIARYPASPRGTSRLLVALPPPDSAHPLHQHVRRAAAAVAGGPAAGAFVDASFGDLASLLPRGAHLVFNDSAVFAARLFADAAEPPGAPPSPVEVMFLAPAGAGDDPSTSLAAPAAGQRWRCMIRRHYDAPGVVLPVLTPPAALDGLALRLTALHSTWVEDDEQPGVEADVEFQLPPRGGSVTLGHVFAACGHIPLPPYMRRDAEPSDAADYQTVYACDQSPGSVAAPTAGLHFTAPLLAELESHGVTSSKVALHVSAATFRPVTAPVISGHAMHEERFRVTPAALAGILAAVDAGRPLVPVGTTSARLLETLYWLGAREVIATAAGTPAPGPSLALSQWEPYDMCARAGGGLPCPPGDALRALAARTRGGDVTGATSLCIAPGYRFALVAALVTNFHQPDSTLLLLVAALLGGRDRLTAAYDHALARRYRFLSYGDACLFCAAEGGEGS